MDIRAKIAELLGLKKAPEEDGLSGFTPEQLEQAEKAAKDAFAAAKESKDFDTARAAVEAFEAVQAEVTSRAGAEAELASKFSELESRITVSDAEGEGEGNGDGDGSGDGDGDGEGDGEAAPDGTEGTTSAPEAEAPVVEAKEEPKVEAIAADAQEPKAEKAEKAEEAPAPTPKKSTSVPKPSAPPATSTRPVRIVASADVDGHSAGASMPIGDLGEAFTSKAGALSGGRFRGRSKVATAMVEYPDDRSLSSRVDPSVNQEKIDRVVAQAQRETAETLRQIAITSDSSKVAALTAAGGLCAPVNVRYDICEQGDDVRPLRDSLVRFGANRGGIRFVSPPQLSDVTGAVQITTEEQDTTGSTYPKDCITVGCGEDTEVTVQAISLCMEVGNWQRLSFPENFRAWWKLGQVSHARTAETELWDNMCSLSTAVSAGEGLGAARDVIAQIERAAAQFRWRFRISPNTPLRLWAPDFLKNIMRVDLARQAPGDSTLGVTDAELARYFAVRNIAVSFVLDAQSPGGVAGDVQAAGGLNPWPDTVEVILALEGTFLFLDRGRLDFGTEIRDFDQIRTNDVGAFMETFENVAAVCNGPLCLTLNICPDGTTAGPDADFDPCTIGS